LAKIAQSPYFVVPKSGVAAAERLDQFVQGRAVNSGRMDVSH
jgi:hypothetical protein